MVQLILMKGHFKENTVVYTKIKVLNKNKQVSLTFIIDDVDTQIRYADGTSRLLSDIRIGQEIEVEYELGNKDEKAYAHVIRLND